MQDSYKILFIGDIVGRAGRKDVKKFLLNDNGKQNYDFINANAETTLIGRTKPPITGFKPEIGSDSRFV